jgi:hypothetical protein
VETERAAQVRIAALFSVQGPGEQVPALSVSAEGEQVVFRSDQASGAIHLSPRCPDLLQVRYEEECLEIDA